MVQMLFGACLVLLGGNGEVQIFLNFVLQGFRFYDILAVLSGEKEERKTASCGNGIIYA